MQIVIANKKYPSQVVSESHTSSRHTGNPLASREIRFAVHNEDESNEIRHYLNSVKELRSLEDDGTERSWAVGTNSDSHQVGSDRGHLFTVNLSEKEEWNIEHLIIDGYEITPYSYSEEISNGAIIIVGKVILDSTSINDFRLLRPKDRRYFEVVRQGISDRVLSMRFGRVLEWSKSGDGGAIKQAFNLVEESFDANPYTDFANSAQIDRLIQHNIQLEHSVQLLIDKLSAAGLIAKTEVQSIDPDAKVLKMYDYYEVADVDTEMGR